MRVVKFIWDNHQDSDITGKNLIIGQLLPKCQNDDIRHIETYGIALDIIDDRKDFRLHRHSCFSGNIVSEVSEISKQEARDLLIMEIDKALDILYSESEQEDVNSVLNPIAKIN